MRNVLAQAGREFLKAFGAAVVILAPGVMAATNLDEFKALGVAALGSAIVAGVKAVQVFVPQLSLVGLFPAQYVVVASWLDTFLRAAVAFALVFAVDWWNAGDYSDWRAAVTGALIGAVTAGFRALEGLLTKGEQPSPNTGL